MISAVPCPNSDCIYQKDGLCTLETPTSAAQDLTPNNKDCVYFSRKNHPK
ncbi:MAG: hypothetical protein ACI4DY_02735 [Monoglobaceae bacterium]